LSKTILQPPNEEDSLVRPAAEGESLKVSASPHVPLTPQELNVLQLLSKGLGTVGIAEILQIDGRTVQNYITTLRWKTGCNQRTQLVDWYQRTLSPRDND
jgi:DNA-binding NarL/FixJ family response regulator